MILIITLLLIITPFDTLAWGATPEKKVTFSYTSEGRRDPFRPPEIWLNKNALLTDTQAPGKRKTQRKKELLEAFQLDSLTLVAIFFRIEGQKPVAMFQDPDGMGHLVRCGSYIGTNEGRVEQIQDNQVVIVEPLHNYAAGRTTGQNTNDATRTITLMLHEKGQEPDNAPTLPRK